MSRPRRHNLFSGSPPSIRAGASEAGVQGTRDRSEVDKGCDARRLGAGLKGLIAQYDLAEAEYERASKRCYTPQFKARLGNPQLTDKIRDGLREQREQETGFDRAVEERSELIYAQILAFIDVILAVQSTSPDVLALKASACLWERPAEDMDGDGAKRAAIFLTQLAAL